MKKLCAFLLAMLFVSVLCLPAAAEEEDPFDHSYRRFNDFSGFVTEEEESQLNAKVREQLIPLQMDFPVCVFETRQSTNTIAEFADDYYARNLYGCGEEKSGILLVVDLGRSKFSMYYYGEADTLIDDDARDALSDAFLEDYNSDAYSPYEIFERYYDAAFATVIEAREHPNTEPVTNAETGMPVWYPANTEGFQDFHGEDLPPVVDDAHIFTARQFKELSEKISSINERLGISYVAFTSNDNYGLLPEEYSSDFLHFNGYGVGDEYGAVVFYLSLDPEDRCWLTTSINSYESLFTYDVTYEIDELVDSSIRGGEYYEAFRIHADYVEKMFASMSEDLPAWYPEGTRTYDLDREKRTYAPKLDAGKPRIVDNAGVLSAELMGSYTQTLQTLSQQYGLDLVIFTDPECRTPKKQQYAEDFYYYNGYAADGICLYVLDVEHHPFGVLYYGEGSKYEELDLDAEIRSEIGEGKAAEAIGEYIEKLAFMLEHDRLPMHAGTAGFCVVVGVVAGLIAAGVVLSKMKKKMVITRQTSAVNYLDDNSFQVFDRSHSFLYTSVTRTAKPKPTESSGGSSGGGSRGGSSYSSGRSAGGSYSSGGRRF